MTGSVERPAETDMRITTLTSSSGVGVLMLQKKKQKSFVSRPSGMLVVWLNIPRIPHDLSSTKSLFNRLSAPFLMKINALVIVNQASARFP